MIDSDKHKGINSIYIHKPVSPECETYFKNLSNVRISDFLDQSFDKKAVIMDNVTSAASIADIVDIINQIEKIRGRKQLSIFTAFLDKPEAPTSISSDVYNLIVKTVNEGGYESEPIDIIIHSEGGNIYETKRIVTFLRSKFDNIDFLIAHSAFSAATIMSLSGDNIIMPSYAALGPTDVHYKLKSGEWLPENIYLTSLKTIKKSMSLFSTTRSIFIDNYAIGELDGLANQITREKLYAPRLTEYFLLKYMFKCKTLKEPDVLDKFRSKSYITSMILNYKIHKKAMNATSFFCVPQKHISHNHKIMFSDITHLGLNLQKPAQKLESLLWSLHEKHSVLFRQTNINVITFTSTSSRYNYLYTSLHDTN